MTRIAVIAAVGLNGAIGYKGRLPWGDIPEDLRHFKKVTSGHAVVMGRKTWESLEARSRAPLPNRTCLVVTSRPVVYENAVTVRSLREAIALGHPRLFVIGGARLYEEALPLAEDVYLTVIDESFPGDVFFPKYDLSEFFVESAESVRPPPPRVGLTFTHYTKRDPLEAPTPLPPEQSLVIPRMEQLQRFVGNTKGAPPDPGRKALVTTPPEDPTGRKGLRALRLFEAALQLTAKKPGYKQSAVSDPWTGKPLVVGELPDQYRCAGRVSPAYAGDDQHCAVRLWVTQSGRYRLDSWSWNSRNCVTKQTGDHRAWDPSIETIAPYLGISGTTLEEAVRHIGED